MRLAEPIALSGLNAAQTRLAVSAHNVANASTEPYTPQTVALSTAAGGGVQAQVQLQLQRGSASGVDLNRDLVEQLSARNDFLANLAVFRRANTAAGTVLRLLA